MLQQDGLAVLARQRRGDDVAQRELRPGARVAGAARLLDDVVVQAACLGRKSVDAREAVAAVDVGVHRAWTDAVARIQLAVALHRMLGAPARLRPALFAVFNAAAVRFGRVAVIELDGAQVMLVTALHVHQFAEQAAAHHLQHCHHVAPIAHVLQQHIGGAGLELRVQYIPVVLQADACHHFAAHRHLGLHGVDCH